MAKRKFQIGDTVTVKKIRKSNQIDFEKPKQWIDKKGKIADYDSIDKTYHVIMRSKKLGSNTFYADELTK